jgi:DNA-binding phage protein
MKILEEFITEVRKFGIRKVARLSGISEFTIGQWLYQGAIPSLVNAQKVANAMGLEFLIFEKLED